MSPSWTIKGKPILDALLLRARVRAERLQCIDVASLPAHRRLAYDAALERVRQVMRLTDANTVEAAPLSCMPTAN